MTKRQFMKIVDQAFKLTKSRSPYKTGNLRDNAIRLEWVNDNEARIYVEENIAPYMVFTNEEWINRAGKNPHEEWWGETAQEIAEMIAKTTKGVLK